VAIFGRNTARQRLRRAAQESLRIPAFSVPADCAPWVTGGLWPAELSTVNVDTAPLVKYLQADLQRIVNSANDELKDIRRAGLADPRREAEEARVIQEARAYAVRRVESTVRHLRNATTKSPAPQQPANSAAEAATTQRFKLAPTPPAEPAEPAETPGAQTEFEHPTIETPIPPAESGRVEELDRWAPVLDGPQPVVAEPEPSAAHLEPAIAEPEPVEEADTAKTARLSTPNRFDSDDTEALDSWAPVADGPELVIAEPEPSATHLEPAIAEPEQVETDTAETARLSTPNRFDSDDTEALDELASLLEEYSATLAPPPTDPPPRPVSMFEPPNPAPVPEQVRDSTVTARHLVPEARWESEPERLERLLTFVARQEPGLAWAVGDRNDGTTLLVTDLAHGWIPPGIEVPAEIHILEPGWRTGTLAALLGETTRSVTYAPGDPLEWSADYGATNTSPQPRVLPEVDDVGRVLSEATHWRDGLPRMVNTLAKAGTAGIGIVRAEIDILRTYLDTARYQLLAQYPNFDAGLLLNCLLLAATEAVASQDRVNAIYHLAWFQTLSAPPRSG
jgi:hypothetical protein